MVDPANGNARGDDAVDLQTFRSLATNVASGNVSVIAGGDSNTASGTGATVGGGGGNEASGASWPTVAGGQGNVASGL